MIKCWTYYFLSKVCKYVCMYVSMCVHVLEPYNAKKSNFAIWQNDLFRIPINFAKRSRNVHINTLWSVNWFFGFLDELLFAHSTYWRLFIYIFMTYVCATFFNVYPYSILYVISFIIILESACVFYFY